MVDAFVAVSLPRHAALTQAALSIPSPAQVRALIDTGASGTCVDLGILLGLGLTPTGSVPVSTPSTGSTPHTADQYDVGLVIPAPSGPPLAFGTIPVLGCELHAAQGFHVLVGRDILARCVFMYNGAAGLFTLAY